jgi:hypothetical protein
MKVKRALFVLAGVLCLAGCSAPREPKQAAIRGRFVLQGPAPEARALKVDKDRDCCGQRPLVSEELVVGADRGVANVVVYIRDKKIPSLPGEKLEVARISMAGCRFEPHISVVQVGQELVLEGSECVGHIPNLISKTNAPWGILLPAKGRCLIRFSSPDQLPAPLLCNIHPWMKGWVVIHPNKYVAISGKDGAFEIKDVPHGVWELQFWHEKAGCIEKMSIGGVVKKFPKGRMQVEVGPGGVDFGPIALEFENVDEGQAEQSLAAESR